MNPYVTYGGREQTEPGVWRVSFDLHSEPPTPPKRYWTRFDSRWDPIDIDAPNFWSSMAFLGAYFIENGQYDEETGELNLPVREVVERAKSTTENGMLFEEPRLGQVCGRFGTPPYDGDTSDDAFKTFTRPPDPRRYTKGPDSRQGQAGVAYRTNVSQGSSDEGLLQQVRAELADLGQDSQGVVKAELFLMQLMDAGPVVGLWVASDLEREADSRLAASGFRLRT